MDDSCSPTFTRKLEQYFSIFVPKIQAKLSKSNSCKSIFRDGKTMQPEPPNGSTAVILKDLPFD